MSQGTANPTLPDNAAQEAGGNLALIQTVTVNQLVILMQGLLTEQKITNYLLAAGLNVKDDLNNLRNDPSFL